MDNAKLENLKQRFRTNTSGFLHSHANWKTELVEAIQRFKNLKNDVYLCGGVARDLLPIESLNQKCLTPRDVDIIVNHAKPSDIKALFRDASIAQNQFGGLSIKIGLWKIDAWVIQNTWAFKNAGFKWQNIEDYTKSTFLNIDAVAIQLFTTQGKKRNIYSNGFFEAITEKYIEINYKDNPNPPLCIVRSLEAAKKYNFKIGPRLARYINNHSKKIDLQELVALRNSRYKDTIITSDHYHHYLEPVRLL